MGMMQGFKFSSMVFPGNTLSGQKHTTKNAPKTITAFDVFPSLDERYRRLLAGSLVFGYVDKFHRSGADRKNAFEKRLKSNNNKRDSQMGKL